MNSYFKRYFVIALLAIAAIWLYVSVPPGRKSIVIWPGLEANHIKSFANTDTQSSQVLYQDSAGQLQIVFQLQASDPSQAWATLQLDLQSIDQGTMNWLFMDSLILELYNQGTPELMLKILTWDPDVSQKGDPSTYRVLTKEFALSPGLQRIAIPAEHLYVPDWWYDQKGVSKDLDSKHLESVSHLEISTTDKSPRHSDIRLSISHIRVEGPKRTHFVLLLAFLFILALAAIGFKPPQGPVS